MITTARATQQATAHSTLISLRGVTKTYSGPAGKPIPVLEGIDLEVAEGEFVALLGRSGSGKSTLLRCIAGLIAPSSGEVVFAGSPVRGTNRHAAMVFQTFALLPWLTVQQNVEIGLEARGVAPAARVERAVRAIDVVGLDGYETAFPKELSGGMRQRVGFARALVVEPDALLMDEPFSALDVLTAENLRGELLELWEGHRFPTRSIVMVTHNIEEAVLLADRILVLGSNPGRIRAELRNALPRPRRRRTPDFDELVDRIYAIMTERAQPQTTAPATRPARERGTPGDTPLPHATVDGLSGLAEILQNRGGGADLADLADVLGLEIGDLLALVDALVLLGFAGSDKDHVRLTPSGTVFAGASIQDSKEIFAAAVLTSAPLVRTIDGALHGARDGNLPSGFFVDILRRSYDEEEGRRQLDVAINWGRYAELYTFDAARGQVIREDHVDRSAVTAGEEAPRRGRLRVYLGAAPGAGTTFAMLRDGQARRARGEDVVIGAVETHGRPRTIEAIGDLEAVPHQETPAGGRELDLDALLERRPDVVLVDDLAHANPSGTRHAKRWQDVDELRDAGIDVVASVEVRNVESVKDLAERATGSRVVDTVPDAVLEEAEEVQFVDISPEALRKRIRHGNVYPPDQVEDALRAVQPASLEALRDIALQLMAQGIGPTRPGAREEPQDVLVAVSGGPASEAMVRRAARLARRTGGRCSVLHVVDPRRPTGAAELARLSELADQLGATLVVREGRDVVTVIRETVRELVVDHLVVGEPRRQRLLDTARRTIAERLIEDLPDIDVHVLAQVALRPAGRPKADGSQSAAGDDRSDPERAAGNRGSLRVYLGYARGCGTTTAMLDEARRRRSRGTDVVVAAVTTHDRAAVEEALGDLELVAPASTGTLDVDAVLARNPQVACVDDLTGPTVDGAPRIAAIPRLLGAGITLIATLHVSDLDGPGPTGDSILDLADEVELVDLTPPALIERLRRSDIVPAADVERALESDEFRPDTLAAQRETAFRLVARRTERRLVGYVRERRIDAHVETRTRVLACVPPREGLERLIRDAAALAGSIDGDFTAATVRTRPDTDRERDLLDAYAALTQELGGKFVTLEGPSVARALADYARENLVTEMMLTRGRPHRRARRSTLRELIRLAADIDVHVVSGDPVLRR